MGDRDLLSVYTLSEKWHQFYVFLGLFLVSLFSGYAIADSNKSVRFTDIAANDANGISYRHIGFRNGAFLDSTDVFSVAQVTNAAVRLPPLFYDIPGVAVFDFDRDGDLDLYISNYRGAANSLYANQMKENGEVSFIDVAIGAGVAATDHDSAGVCFGDIDNDNDDDLLVLGGQSPNRLFENSGNGHFTDITSKSMAGLGSLIAASCSMGDVNGDGLLDLFIANSYEQLESGVIVAGAFNELFLNQGGNTFVNVSTYAGIHMDSNQEEYKGITWSSALVDYDQDGDVDIVLSDDGDGFTRIFNNDGKGHFTDVTVAVGTDRPGSWMGLAFGDLNSDGNMDIFNSNIGDYFVRASFFYGTPPGTEFPPGFPSYSSAWFLGQDDGTFIYPGTGALGETPFGWGASMADYDNDADTDIVYHGGMNMGLIADATNPGVILQNDGAANFKWDKFALAGSTNHSRRAARGMAMADLNDDGFPDIISASSMDWSADLPLVPLLPYSLSGQFDEVAFNWPQFTQVDPTDFNMGFTWNDNDPIDGTLSVEINSGDNGNNWVKVKLLGGMDLTSKGRVNRDGIGAVVSFTPKHGKPVMRPIIGGASHASADSLEAGFGLGSGKKGVIEVLWPGGVRNKLYKARAEERIVFPEIPCSYDDGRLSEKEYNSCVKQTLNELVDAGVLNKTEHGRFMSSAKRAFEEYRDDDNSEDHDHDENNSVNDES